MKQHGLILFLFLAAYSASSYAMDSTPHIMKMQRHNDILSLHNFPEISFQSVLDTTGLITKSCFNEVIKPAGVGFVTAMQWTTPYVFAYIAACLIDPKPHDK